MTRNTVKRVEVAVPVYDPDIQNRVVSIFETMLDDDVKARVQGSDGMYRKKSVHKKNLSAQDEFIRLAVSAAKAPPVPEPAEDESSKPDFSDFYREYLMQS